jgi:hypothetical protein
MSIGYDEFLARAREARPRPDFYKELRALYVDGGTLQLLVKGILEQRQDLMEALMSRPMMTDQDIRAAIGTQGQINGIDIVLQGIHSSMLESQDEPTVDEAITSRAAQVP